MPGSITHYLFAKDCLSSLNINSFENIIKNNMEMYILGCQGPNFFCYYSYLPFVSNKNLSILANKIHSENINDFIKNMIFYSKDMSCTRYIFNGREFSETTFAYLLGYLSHYALDSHTHPYIYSLQFSLSKKYKRKTSRALHKSIETHIDKLLLKKLKNITPYTFDEYKNTSINNYQLIILCDMYTFLLKKVFNKSLSYSDINKCIRAFEKTENRLNNTNNLYSTAYLKLKNITSKDSDIESKIYSNHIHCINDLLNNNNSNWVDPFSKSENNLSFNDIYKESLDYYIDLINTLFSYVKNEKTMDEIINKIGDNSYLTNQNWKINYKII